jgi:hypothetical protein
MGNDFPLLCMRSNALASIHPVNLTDQKKGTVTQRFSQGFIEIAELDQAAMVPPGTMLHDK